MFCQRASFELRIGLDNECFVTWGSFVLEEWVFQGFTKFLNGCAVLRDIKKLSIWYKLGIQLIFKWTHEGKNERNEGIELKETCRYWRQMWWGNNCLWEMKWKGSELKYQINLFRDILRGQSCCEKYFLYSS